MRNSAFGWTGSGTGVLSGGALLYLLLAVSSAAVAHADNWGCDLVNSNTGLHIVDDCGSKGACCDAHDEGFHENGCSASSFFHTACLAGLPEYCLKANACDAVNLAAVACIASENPGPGACCDFFGHNICQQGRNPNNYWGCNGDAWCDADSRCDLTTGTCVTTRCTYDAPTRCDRGWTDSCGNTYQPTGCPDPLQCVDGACVRCQPATCSASDGQCGTFDDGCGGTIDCGCQDPQTCQSGVCTAPSCTPFTCDDFGYSGTFWDGCSDYITCDFGDPGDGSSGSGNDGSTGGGGCTASGYPPWCPYYCTDVFEE